MPNLFAREFITRGKTKDACIGDRKQRKLKRSRMQQIYF